MSTRNTIITAILTSLITSICTFFLLDYVKSRKKRHEHVLVPQVVGMKPSQAMEVLDGRKLRLNIIERRPDSRVPAGQICSQHPLPDSKVPIHSPVNVVLSAGPPKMKVPTCEGTTLQAFTNQLTRRKLKLGPIKRAPHQSLKPGQVISCEPPTGTVVEPGATVEVVVVQTADPLTEIPKLRGTSCSKAKKKIAELGFKVGKIRWRVFDAPPYLVMQQSPDPGTKAKPGTAVDLTCSQEE